jgi:hypothetical protein
MFLFISNLVLEFYSINNIYSEICLNRTLNKLVIGPKASTAPIRTASQQQSYGMSMSPPKGQKVAELSRTIEMQLAVSMIYCINMMKLILYLLNLISSFLLIVI